MLLTGIIAIVYKLCYSNKAKGTTKIFLFFNQITLSDFTIRKYEGKVSIYNAFLMRMLQKFINIILSKMLLYREMPCIRDELYFLLLMMHFMAFYLFLKSNEDNVLIKKVIKSKLRLMT